MSEWQPVSFLGAHERSPDERSPNGGSRGREKQLDDDDPYELVGVQFVFPEGTDGDREVARCIVEEYALMGWRPERIRELFTDPRYTGAHDVVRRRGTDIVDEAITTVFGAGCEREGI